MAPRLRLEQTLHAAHHVVRDLVLGDAVDERAGIDAAVARVEDHVDALQVARADGILDARGLATDLFHGLPLAVVGREELGKDQVARDPHREARGNVLHLGDAAALRDESGGLRPRPRGRRVP
jgi:hypothetical protein